MTEEKWIARSAGQVAHVSGDLTVNSTVNCLKERISWTGIVFVLVVILGKIFSTFSGEYSKLCEGTSFGKFRERTFPFLTQSSGHFHPAAKPVSTSPMEFTVPMKSGELRTES